MIKRIRLIHVALFWVAFVCTLLIYHYKEIPIYAEDAEITALNAFYQGPAVMVGKEIDLTQLIVTATYSDGVSNVIEDYSIVSKKVTEEGTNTGTVIYQGKTANYYVVGKTIRNIYVTYAGFAVSVDNAVNPKDITVYVDFNDNSMETPTDFSIYSAIIKNEGWNDVFVQYAGKINKIQVYGLPIKEIAALYATYSGGEITVGNEVDKSDLIITAAYKDGSTEIINNYQLTPSVVTKVGSQTVVASYHGKSVNFNVTGAYKLLTGISAKYIGNPVGVGHSVRPSDVVVTGIYNDNSTDTLTEFNLLSSTITYIGYHIVTVEVDGYKTDFIVQGVEETIIDFTHGPDFYITNGVNTGKVTIALPKNMEETVLTGDSLNSSYVTSVLTRAVRKSTYIAFTIEETDEDILDEFPLSIKIEIPTEFDLEATSLYFTPNRKTVIGKMNTSTVGPNILMCDIHNTGTYILAFKN